MLKKMKAPLINWLLARRSADDTSNRGVWIMIGLVLILIVGGIITAAATDGFTNLGNLFVNTTEGNQVDAPGQWGTGN